METEQNIGLTVRALSNLFRRRIDCEQEKIEDGVMTGIHGWIVGYLSRQENKQVFQCELEQVFEVRRSTMSETLNTMERNGLITRKKDPSDGRKKEILLTEKARKLHLQKVEQIQKLESAAAEGLTQEELEAFFSTAMKVKQNLENYAENK